MPDTRSSLAHSSVLILLSFPPVNPVDRYRLSRYGPIFRPATRLGREVLFAIFPCEFEFSEDDLHFNARRK